MDITTAKANVEALIAKYGDEDLARLVDPTSFDVAEGRLVVPGFETPAVEDEGFAPVSGEFTAEELATVARPATASRCAHGRHARCECVAYAIPGAAGTVAHAGCRPAGPTTPAALGGGWASMSVAL